MPRRARRLALALAALLLALAPAVLRGQSGRRQPGAKPTPTPQRPRRAPAPAHDPPPGQPSTPDAPSTTATPRAEPSGAGAQSAEPPIEDDEVYKVESNLVPVSANVTEATTGRAVIDLKAEDFELRVDGQPKPISDLSFSETPVRLALLFDNSSSIRPTRELEKHAAAGFFRAVLRPVDQGALFSIATYPTLDLPLTSDAAKLARTIEAYGDVENSTALFDTIVMAAEYLQPMPGRKVVVIVSDGVETTSRLTDFGEVVRRVLAADCQVFVIQTGLSDNANLRDLMAERRMLDLTASTGGAVFTPKRPADLEGAFTQISNDLRQQYVLSYYPSDDGRDGRFRSIALRVKTRPNLRVRARRGYYPRRRADSVSSNQQSYVETGSAVNGPAGDESAEASPTPAARPQSAPPEMASAARSVAPRRADGPAGGSKNMDFEASGEPARANPSGQSAQPAVRLGNFKPPPVEPPASTAQTTTDARPELKRSDDAAPPETNAADRAEPAPTPRPDPAKQAQTATASDPPATRARTAPTRDSRPRPAGSKADRQGGESQGEPGKSAVPGAPISGGVLNGRAVSLPRPVYPAPALRMRAVGTVSVEVTIDESGKVISARAVSGHALLREAAVAAALRARFSPTLVSGMPVRVAGTINYSFSL